MSIVISSLKFGFLAIAKRQSFGWFLKEACQNSGIAYTKLAQILATRTDLLSEKSIQDLRSISDNVNPIPVDSIISTLEDEYQKPLNETFPDFDKSPLGSASISQVHKATLKDGSIVAVKVKRKDLLNNIEHDLAFMKNVLRFLSIFSKKVRFVRKSGVVDDYFSWIISETDFTCERKNLRRMYDYTMKLNADSGNNIVPIQVYDDLCTENVIVMDFIPYKTLSQGDNINSETVRNGLNSFLSSYFYAVFNYDKVPYHGDPHAGNIFFDEHGNMGLLDYGLVFELSKRECEIIRKLAILAYTRDVDGLQKELLALVGKYRFKPREYRKERKLNYDLQVFADSLDNITITDWFMQMAFIMLRNNLNGERLRFFYRFSKTIATFDGIVVSSADSTVGATLLEEQFRRYYKREKLQGVIKEAETWVSDLLWLASSPNTR